MLRYVMLFFLLCVPLAAAACDSGEELTDCELAFRRAANISDLEDTVEDLDWAIRECETLEEWNAASRKYPDALDGVNPETFLRNRCEYGNFASSSMCGELD